MQTSPTTSRAPALGGSVSNPSSTTPSNSRRAKCLSVLPGIPEMIFIEVEDNGLALPKNTLCITDPFEQILTGPRTPGKRNGPWIGHHKRLATLHGQAAGKAPKGGFQIHPVPRVDLVKPSPLRKQPERRARLRCWSSMTTLNSMVAQKLSNDLDTRSRQPFWRGRCGPMERTPRCHFDGPPNARHGWHGGRTHHSRKRSRARPPTHRGAHRRRREKHVKKPSARAGRRRCQTCRRRDSAPRCTHCPCLRSSEAVVSHVCLLLANNTSSNRRCASQLALFWRPLRPC